MGNLSPCIACGEPALTTYIVRETGNSYKFCDECLEINTGTRVTRTDRTVSYGSGRSFNQPGPVKGATKWTQPEIRFGEGSKS